jgi:hypothetical protein
MRFVLVIAVVAIALSFFSARAANVFDRKTTSPAASINNVSELLRRASSGEPLDGRAPPDRRWVARMAAACNKRERRLAAVPYSTTASGIAARGTRILAIHRTYAARASSLRPQPAYAADTRAIRSFNASQQRIIKRVVAAAQTGDLARSYREAIAMRELAGRANTVFLRLGLPHCAFRASGMPL